MFGAIKLVEKPVELGDEDELIVEIVGYPKGSYQYQPARILRKSPKQSNLFIHGCRDNESDTCAHTCRRTAQGSSGGPLLVKENNQYRIVAIHIATYYDSIIRDLSNTGLAVGVLPILYFSNANTVCRAANGYPCDQTGQYF